MSVVRRLTRGVCDTALGSTPLRDITRKDVNELVAKLLRKGLSPETVARYIAPVRALFSGAVDAEDLSANPALKLTINAKANREQRRSDDEATEEKTLTRPELLAAILAAIPDRWRLLFDVLAGTGVISEALGLDWTDLAQHGES